MSKVCTASGLVRFHLHVANGTTPERVQVTVPALLLGSPNPLYVEMDKMGLMGSNAELCIPKAETIIASLTGTYAYLKGSNDPRKVRTWQDSNGNFRISYPSVWLPEGFVEQLRASHKSGQSALARQAWAYSTGVIQLRARKGDR